MNFIGDMENFPPASNFENTYMRRFYLQKHAELELEMQSLRELKHPEYTSTIQMLEEQFKTELEAEEIADQLEKERIEEQYEREKEAAEKELEERLTELMEAMIQECEEQKKKIDHEFHNSDISSAPANDFPSKKSLRRRPNEPTPYSEKHTHAKTRPNIADALTDQEIQEDLLLLEEAELKSA
ncbi:unnamed protein product [Wuchereria bancrofti]|uniref:Coiled-coil domain-containing protein n=1 Tax=Wuchereria bancrofti TaxID=6293 RepID=A0A183XCX6_WUCBA|nr:unnamed protein product [Wuchereria bancrofti]